MYNKTSLALSSICSKQLISPLFINRNAIALTEIWNEFLLHALYLIENIFILFVDNYDMYYKNKILLNSTSAAI